MLKLNTMLSLRNLSILGFLICSGALAGAIYLEQEYMLSPCPMCMLQRIVFGILGIIFFIGIFIKFLPKLWHYVYIAQVVIFSALGLSIAVRQFWLQHFATDHPLSCSAGLARLIEAYPILDALKIVLRGSAECATIDYTILTISFAGWGVIIFGLFLIISLYELSKIR